MDQNEQSKGTSALVTILKVVWLVGAVVIMVAVGRIACSDGTPHEKLDALIGGIE